MGDFTKRRRKRDKDKKVRAIISFAHVCTGFKGSLL